MTVESTSHYRWLVHRPLERHHLGLHASGDWVSKLMLWNCGTTVISVGATTKTSTIVGSRLSWMEGFKTIFFTLNHFWTVVLDPILIESFMGLIHRCTKRLGFQPLERLGSGGRIFLLRGEGKHPHQNEGFFKVMNLSGTISPHLLRGLGITAGKNNGPSSRKGAREFHFLGAASHCLALWTRVTLQVWTCAKYVPSSPFRSTVNTSYITGLDMCKVCTKAVHSVALWTRVRLQVWTCVKYVPKQSIP